MGFPVFSGIILASESPRRRKLLEKMDIVFQTIPSDLVEMPPLGERPNVYASRMALEKAVKVGQAYADYLIVGADTVVAVDAVIMGKPKSPEEALLMLSRLSNRWHEVWTGICVYNQKQNIQIVQAVCSSVRFRNLSLQDIEEYVKSGEPMDKAGAYAIQGRGKVLVKEIKGSFHNIIGLPTLELGKIFQQLGISTNTGSVETAY
ncbi:MAG: Maf family protein [Candidatus Omnitrophota bacterium]